MKKLLGTALGTAGVIAVLTALARAAGFVRAWVQNGALGATAAGEAYSTANTVPNVLFEIAAGGALAAAVIPLISGFLAKHLAEDVSRTASALFTWVIALGVPLAAAVSLGAYPIVSFLLGAGTDPGEVAFGASLLRMFSWQIPLYGISVVCTGVLQAHKKFVLPALAPLLNSVVVIGIFVLFAHVGGGHQNDPARISQLALYILGWGTTAGVAAFSLPQLIPVMRRVRLRPTFRFPAGVGRRALRLCGAGLAGLVAQQIQIVAIMLFANSQGDTGTYPVYTFANQLYMVPYAVLAVPIATAVFPRLSEAAALPGRPGLAKLTARSTRLVFDIGLVCVALLVAVALPAQRVFDVLRPAEGMATAMAAMAPGLLGYAVIYHGSRVLYAVEAAGSVVTVNSLAWLSVVAALGVGSAVGVSGRREVLATIGIALSVGMLVGAVGQVLAIRHCVGKDAVRGLSRSILVVLPAAIAGGAAGYGAGVWCLHLLGTGLMASLLATVVAGALVLLIGGGSIVVVDRHELASRGGAAVANERQTMAELSDAFTPGHITDSQITQVYGGFVNVFEEEATLSTTSERFSRTWIDRGDAVGVLALRQAEDGEEALLIRQYRLPVRSMMWEIPAGILDVEGEAPADAALRELREETDYEAESIEPLVSYFSSPGFNNERLILYVARGLSECDVPFQREAEEAEIEKRWVRLDDVVAGVLAGDLQCPTLAMAALAYRAKSQRG